MAACALTSCAAVVSERHYFATTKTNADGTRGDIVNIFRMDVDAQGGFSNIRYVAGNYDERAVEFFFNETKTKDYTIPGTKPTSTMPGIDAVFQVCAKPPKPKKKTAGESVKGDEETQANGGLEGRNNDPAVQTAKPGDDGCIQFGEERLKLVPLTGAGGGPLDAFVIILSADANAIAETFGAFAENEMSMQSISYLLNRDDYKAASDISAKAPVQALSRKALVDSLENYFSAEYAGNPAGNSDVELTILQMIATGLDAEGSIPFETVEEARQWFAGRN